LGYAWRGHAGPKERSVSGEARRAKTDCCLFCPETWVTERT
jgi:hypothetical protein